MEENFKPSAEVNVEATDNDGAQNFFFWVLHKRKGKNPLTPDHSARDTAAPQAWR